MATAWSRRRVLQGSAATVVLAAAAGGTWWALRPERNTGLRPVIAVLPFEDLSAEKSQATLARALSEEVLLALGKSDRLTVIARGSMQGFQPDSSLALVSRKIDAGYAVVRQHSARRGSHTRDRASDGCPAQRADLGRQLRAAGE